MLGLFDTLLVLLKEIFERANFEKDQQITKNHIKITTCKALIKAGGQG